MFEYDKLQYHPMVEKLVDILCKKTQNINPHFFRILVNYHLTKLPAMMRASILTKDRGIIPINIYAINLGNSGLGKGHATNIIEDSIIKPFKNHFFDITYPQITEINLAQLAAKRATVKGEDPDEELVHTEKEFAALGPLPFAFDSATTPAVKQMRHKLLMGGIGAMNLEIDEIGSNLLSNADALATFLELFDIGKLKQKLIKNTKDSVRNEEIDGRTPTNLFLFGTPSKLLNGGKTEEEFYSFLETGYARRCIFGYTRNGTKVQDLTAEEIFDILTDKTLDSSVKTIAKKLGTLAHKTFYNKHLILPKEVSILAIKYRLHCEAIARTFGEHEEIRKAEMEHRYYKALKLSGTYAFIDEKSTITEDHFFNAVKIVEESGIAFTKLLKRARNYAKLAKYIADIHHEVTHVDLTEDLPFYRGSAAQKNDLMQLAIAWGYKNHIIIKKTCNNGIEFLTGETLQKTNLNKIICSYSTDLAKNYHNVTPAFKHLHKLILTPNLHWVNHHLLDGYRDEGHTKHGFNLLVLDIDHGITIDQVKLLMQKYLYLLHTTKRHTNSHHRFRLILPLNYHINLDSKDYKEFMQNVYDWLPFTVDTATGQRSRKWLTNPQAHLEYNKSDTLLDALLFIPKTAKNDEQKKLIQNSQSLSNLERWFVNNTNFGSRNNQLLKYALMLVDMGYEYTAVETSIKELNNKLDQRLTIKEIQNTILTTVAKQIRLKGGTTTPVI